VRAEQVLQRARPATHRAERPVEVLPRVEDRGEARALAARQGAPQQRRAEFAFCCIFCVERGKSRSRWRLDDLRPLS
jgi:hypothetical protein